MEMKIFTFLLLSILLSLNRKAQGAETRQFSRSQVVINNERNITLTTQTDGASFFVIGDQGGIPIFPYRTLILERAASQIESLSKKYTTQFQIALGDNIYLQGVTDVNDERFKKSFENVFDGDYEKNSPWFLTMGNHDHYGNPQAQVDYTYSKKSINNRWIMPSYSYSIDVKTKSQSTLVTIFMVDTIKMCGNTDPDNILVINPNIVREGNDTYFTDLESRLAAAAASSVPYILVAGHFPVWSIASHGPNQCLVNKLRPLLHKYNVSAYFCGHDHDVQHLRDTYMGHTVDYVVSGSGTFSDSSTAHSKDVPANSLLFNWADSWKIFNGGFLKVDVNTNSMTLNYFKTDGTLLYQTTIKPRF